MQDNHQSVELEPAPNTQLNSPNSYVEAPNTYGNASGTQDRLALLHEWQRIIFRHKWLILSLVLVALPFATIYAYRAKPIYQATTTIEIRPETSSLSKTGDVIVVGSNDNTKAEIVIIRSQPVIKQTITSLNLDKNPRFLDVTTKRSVLEALMSLKGGQPEREKKLDQEAARRNADNGGPGEIKTAATEKTAGPENDLSLSDRAEIPQDAEAERKRL